ncbi:MAG: glycine oxidase ThiO [Pirellulales bacterium]
MVVGGGVIGLSVAYELSGAGLHVRLIDRGTPGREASWAGAGILPPHHALPQDAATEKLATASCRLHPHWARQLRDETGIDNGFRKCGGIHLARTPQLAATLNQTADDWRRREVAFETIGPDDLVAVEPALAPTRVNDVPRFLSAYLLPDESQIRNPWHLRALLAACRSRGVDIMAGVAAEGFDVRHDRVTAVRTTAGPLSADRICLTCGCWTAALTARLGFTARIAPIRGQIVLLTTRAASPQRIINEGRRYLVPRPDRRILIGSTEENVGYDCHTTGAGVADLLAFALEIAPALSAAEVKTTWAGLRPETADRVPYIGYVPGLENVLVAAGHFRHGLQLSTGTAVVIRQLVRGEPLDFDLQELNPSRHNGSPA